MSRPDWRDSGAYEELRSLDAPGFAWEEASRRRALTAADEDTFAQRWGVRFRERCRHDRSKRGPVDGKCPRECDSPRGTAG
jgi:hypothetical protein